MNVSRQTSALWWNTPHTLGNDGMYWLVRAFCHIDQKLKDFIFSRCLNVRNLDVLGATPEDDQLWHDHYAGHLVLSPKLSESQRYVIEQDYEMHGACAAVLVLLYYFQKRLRLDGDYQFGNPHVAPVVMANSAAFDAALTESMA